MSVKSQIDRIKGEVSEQTDLIQRIKSAINGKGAGSIFISKTSDIYVDGKRLVIK